MQEKNIMHQPTKWRDTIDGDSLQAQAQRFLLDLELSAVHGSCDETPAHKVWGVASSDDRYRPSYDLLREDGNPLDILSVRWSLDPAAVETYVNDTYGERGQPATYTPEAWADWLGMPVAVYIQLRDLVLNGQIPTLWALADRGDTTAPRTTTDRQRAAEVLAAARMLPPAEQLYLIHRLTDSLQYHLGAVSEEDALTCPPAPRMPRPGTYGSDRN
jgi:hypothetical protein